MSHHREIAAVLVSALAIVGSSLIYRRRHEPQPSLKTAPWDNLVHTREPSDKPSHQPRFISMTLVDQAWYEVAVFMITRQDTRKKGSSGKSIGGFRISVELGHLEIQALIHIPFFHVKAEKYSLGGEERDFPRRDLRKGEPV
eukprot:gene15615-21720_t